MLNTDTELVDLIVLDKGDEYPVDDVRIGDGVVYLLGDGAAAAEDLMGVEEARPADARGASSRTCGRKIGYIRVRKQVRTDRAQVRVPRRREEVHIDRVAAEEDTAAEKRPVVRKEIRLGEDVAEEEKVVEEDTYARRR